MQKVKQNRTIQALLLERHNQLFFGKVSKMSKQDFIQYTIENLGLADSLGMHLSSNFYPPLPGTVKKVFIDAFNQYWSGLIDSHQLSVELSRVYRGSLYDYGFGNYLIHDIEETF